MIKLLSLFFLFYLLTACGGQSSISAGEALTGDNNNSSGTTTGGTTPSEEPPTSGGDVIRPPINLKICSSLNFENVSWSADLSESHVNSYALAMSITGSFEGHNGWSNISNNFDGQGLSLGLFNQNFGQGSLQPLMIRLFQKDPEVYDLYFSSSQKNSLLDMLQDWDSQFVLSKPQPSRFDLDTSDLDKPSEDTPILSFKTAANNRDSVDWAVQTIYSNSAGTQFRSSWRAALRNLAEDPDYVTEQIAAAERINNKALRYMNEYNAKERRSYLFFFDIVVQNGGIQSSVKTAYEEEVRRRGITREYDRMVVLLEQRLKKVRTQFVEDVRSRKMSLLNGTGRVHQSNRNYANEYCVDNWLADY